MQNAWVLNQEILINPELYHPCLGWGWNIGPVGSLKNSFMPYLLVFDATIKEILSTYSLICNIFQEVLVLVYQNTSFFLDVSRLQ